MFSLKCEKCDADLIIDEMLTMDEYLKDMNYLVDKNGNLLDSSIQCYIVYVCVRCGHKRKISYKDWEEMFRKKLAKEAMQIRKQKMFKTLNPYIIDPDNGMEFCGQCDGIEDGNCYVDIIKQCSIRKK